MVRFLFLVSFLAACSTSQPVDQSARAIQEILKADKEMSEMTAASGFHKALLAFAHDSLIKPEDGKLPIVGKQALEEDWKGKNGTKDISWVPTRVEAAMSGELGYSFGNWKYVSPDTTFYGNYYTAWRKGKDGNWKWVIDGGNNTPAPH